MSASGPAARHCRTASYPPPRVIIGPRPRPPAVAAVVPSAGGVPPRRPPAAAVVPSAGAAPPRGPAVAGAAPSAGVVPPRPRPPACGARSTTAGLGASARLAAAAALILAACPVYG